LTPDETADVTLGEKIPPGCANNFNLQRMVERKGDLFQGRNLSPAPAAPSVKAAQKYLNGERVGTLNADKVGTRVGTTGGGVNEGEAAIIGGEPPAGPKQVSTQNR
jgi:hypothetical protein